MHSIIKYPVWLFEILTTAKSFYANPIIGSPLLNRLGLHIVRVVLSHSVMTARMWMLALPLSSEDRKAYFRDGYLLKENFLPQQDFDELEKEVRSFKGEVRELQQGDTLTHRAVLSPDVVSSYPCLSALLNNKRLGQLTRFTAGHARAPLYYIENVKNLYCKGRLDPQKHLHSDTYHPTMKCWFFIDDVSADNGPFTYIPGSHKLTWKRLKWQYKMSITARDAKDSLHARGSTRFTQDDLDKLGLPKPQSFSVQKNTLVLVNVFGIHRRGDSDKKSTRLAIWGDSRTNPFIPFPGINSRFINKLQYNFLNIYRKQCDIKAKKEGKRPPWQVLSADEKL